MGPNSSAATLALTLLSGCSWVFMERLPANFDATKDEPHCTSTTGWAAWDLLATAADVAVIFLASSASKPPAGGEVPTVLIVGVGAEGVLHLVSGFTGFGWASECSDARYDRDRYLRLQEQRQQVLARRNAARRALAAEQRAATKRSPRGFYCAADVCARLKGACQQLRAAAGDPTSCILTESAFCFDVTGAVACSTTLFECLSQRSVAGEAATSTCEARE
jgi:hypothetical protein